MRCGLVLFSAHIPSDTHKHCIKASSVVQSFSTISEPNADGMVCLCNTYTMGLRLFLGSNKFARHNRIGVTKMCVKRRKYLPAIRLSDGVQGRRRWRRRRKGGEGRGDTAGAPLAYTCKGTCNMSSCHSYVGGKEDYGIS